MPDPKTPYTILVTAGSASTAGTVIIEDLTLADSSNPNANRLFESVDSSQKASADLANMTSDYSDGDSLLVKVVGIRSGRGVSTLNTTKGNSKVALSQTSADYAGASVSL